MTEQKYSVGEKVRILPFEEIDLFDIGTASHDEYYCYGIERKRIDKMSNTQDGFIVRKVIWFADREMYRYELTESSTGNLAPFFWAQGMLGPYEEETEFPEPDPDDLFRFFASE